MKKVSWFKAVFKRTQKEQSTRLVVDTSQKSKFDGAYVTQKDDKRLSGQQKDIFDYMKDGQWYRLKDVADSTGYPENSVSAQIRNLRKPKFGGHTVETRYVKTGKGGLYEYRLQIDK
jgi:hypothetical protein